MLPNTLFCEICRKQQDYIIENFHQRLTCKCIECQAPVFSPLIRDINLMLIETHGRRS